MFDRTTPYNLSFLIMGDQVLYSFDVGGKDKTGLEFDVGGKDKTKVWDII